MPRDSDTRPNFILLYKNVLGFSEQVAATVYNDQLFKDAETIAEFGDSDIDNVCRTLRPDSNLPIAKLAVTRLKLLTFWVWHMNRTGHMIGGVELNELTLFKEQKQLEHGWAANNKEPEYTAIALDITSATKAFEKVKTLLTHI
jgi:hypothetical protein